MWAKEKFICILQRDKRDKVEKRGGYLRFSHAIEKLIFGKVPEGIFWWCFWQKFRGTDGAYSGFVRSWKFLLEGLQIPSQFLDAEFPHKSFVLSIFFFLKGFLKEFWNDSLDKNVNWVPRFKNLHSEAINSFWKGTFAIIGTVNLCCCKSIFFVLKGSWRNYEMLFKTKVIFESHDSWIGSQNR